MKTYTIHKEIQINAAAERVFTALTSSEEIPLFFPLKSVESQWIIGGSVLYNGEVNGVPFTDFGLIETLESPSTYAYRYWSDNHGTERAEENYITISYLLENHVDGTLLKVSQSNIKSTDLYELMNNQVWDFLLDSLKQYVETRT